jgi:nucleotide-binding universal stress UspA family protein
MDAQARRVVVGVSGSIANLSALHAAADQARSLDVPLVAVLAWVPVGGELAYRCRPCPPLLRIWGEAAQQRLTLAFQHAFGGLPRDLAVELYVDRAETGPALVSHVERPGDLLVVGTGRPTRWRRLHVGVDSYCRRHARCEVLTVAPPDMINDLRRRDRWPGDDAHVPPLARGFRY